MHQGAGRRVIVLGAGLAGLAAAESLTDDPRTRVTVVEPTGRVGGVLGTSRAEGWLVERSADSFLASRPEALDLVRRLDLEADLIAIEPRVRRALVWHRGRTLPVPAGFRILAPGSIRGILTTPLLSPAGRLRVLAERLVPVRQPVPEESLECFAMRRLGREAFANLVQPLAGGIWTADPARLGMAAACPEFLAFEREHGSLWAGERARRARGGAAAAGARYGQFLTLVGGLETLPRRLAERLESRGVTFVTAAATGLAPTAAGGWTCRLRTAAGVETDLAAAAVVVALPAPSAVPLVAGFDAGLAADLGGIEYAGSAIVSLGYARSQIGHPLDAAGLVVPRCAGRRLLAVSFSSSKFPGRAPAGFVLLRAFVGGALDPDIMRRADAELVRLAREDLEDMLGVRGEPCRVQLDRWPGAMPQYHVGHAERVVRIATACRRHPGLALAGAAYAGVGIPQVIASGRAAAALVAGCTGVDG